MKTWRPALHVLFLLLAVALGAVAGAETPQGETAAAKVEVRLSEHTFGMPHTLVRPGKTGSLQVTLQPGEYKAYCPIGSHAAKGMKMTLVVGQR